MSQSSQRPTVRPHHVTLEPGDTEGNGGLGRVFLLPGSDGRAEAMASLLENVTVRPSPRRLTAYLGQYRARNGSLVDVGCLSTGMGTPSVDIVVTELLALGARLLIRVGTAGTLKPESICVGDVVVATAAVRDESVSDHYAPKGFPALADTQVVSACLRAATRLGLAEHTYAGIVHSKESLYAREFHLGPKAAEHAQYMELLAKLPVLASEMEASHLFVLAALAAGPPVPVGRTDRGTVRAGAVLGIIGGRAPFAEGREVRLAEERAIQVALEGAGELIEELSSRGGGDDRR